MNWWESYKSPIGWIMIATAVVVLLAWKKRWWWLAAMTVLVMAGVQLQTTTPRSLTDLTGDEQRVVELRKSAYPPITWAPIAYWLEEKPVTIAVTRWSESLFENLDLNQYFFAFHPRERVGHKEVEKIPYLLLPIVLLGLWRMTKEKVGKVLLMTTGAALMILAYWGNQTPWGAIATWPMWVGAIYRGLWPKK